VTYLRRIQQAWQKNVFSQNLCLYVHPCQSVFYVCVCVCIAIIENVFIYIYSNTVATTCMQFEGFYTPSLQEA